jgi:dTDP-4-dehydrorhamnose reductase
MTQTTLLSFGHGYCARHYVEMFGARFARIVGTTRPLDAAALTSPRVRGEVDRAERGRVRELHDISGRLENSPSPHPSPRLSGEREQAVLGESEQAALADDSQRTSSSVVDKIAFDGERVSRDLAEAIAQANHVLVSIQPNDSGDPVLATCDAALASSPARAIVYLSTVGVYGNHDGAVVDEDTPPRPNTVRSTARFRAEAAWREFAAKSGKPVAILRLAGIYGPERNAMEQLKAGTARRIVKPGQMFNRIHVADIAQAIDAAFAVQADGLFNICDDMPGPAPDVVSYAAQLLGVAPPPEVPFEIAAKTMSPMALSFYDGNKRVSNAKMKRVLGVRLKYPSYRDGLKALAEGRGG